MGRITIPLILYTNKIISYPSFYLSEFFEHRNQEYQDRLLAVSRDNDWTGWCKFFLCAIETQAIINKKKANKIYELRKEVLEKLFNTTKSANVTKVVDALFRQPIFSSSEITHSDGVNARTGKRLINDLAELGYIDEIVPASGRRPSIYFFPRLSHIVNSDESAS